MINKGLFCSCYICVWRGRGGCIYEGKGTPSQLMPQAIIMLSLALQRWALQVSSKQNVVVAWKWKSHHLREQGKVNEWRSKSVGVFAYGCRWVDKGAHVDVWYCSLDIALCLLYILVCKTGSFITDCRKYFCSQEATVLLLHVLVFLFM